MNLTFRESKIMMENGVWLCLKVNEPAPAREFVLTKQGKLYDCLLKEHRDKRSLDANKYAWALLSQLADVLNTTKEELYPDGKRSKDLSGGVGAAWDWLAHRAGRL